MSLTVHAIEMTTRADGRTIVFRLTGKLTRDDYEMFVPALESAIEEHGRIRLLVDLMDFHGWTAGALWEDIKFDARHFSDIERVALVGESRWEKGMAMFCKPFTAATVRYFNTARRDEAVRWIEEPN
ncbi:MAG: STAS/SEC14 domain-containing protein [Phycisphaerales bacterium]|nr:STAS/SEC14 domain-containing protein [Phycisphaerales bacterium]